MYPNIMKNNIQMKFCSKQIPVRPNTSISIDGPCMKKVKTALYATIIYSLKL